MTLPSLAVFTRLPGKMQPNYPIGIDDFRKLRQRQLEYVDKTHLIGEILDKPGTEVFLLPRPRRFGKTLNLSMLRYFFGRSQEDHSPLFAGLHIWEAGERYRAHFQRYPVVSLSFKGIKSDNYESCFAGIRMKLRHLYEDHHFLLASPTLLPAEKHLFEQIMDGSADEAAYQDSLLNLTRYLHREQGVPAIILIDEYDEPIHSGYLSGYADQVLGFYRNFLTQALKDNPHLFLAVLTGILRVARESIFSGLNNLGVFSLLRPEFRTCFGFTEAEVIKLLAPLQQPELLQSIRSWYNGYVFGGQTVYNPWSVLNFLDSQDKELRNYWVSTSSNDLVRELLAHHALKLQPELETLMAGGTIEQLLDENVVLGQLKETPNALFGLLVFAGYLKAEKFDRGKGEGPGYRLSIPNREVREVYSTTFRQWMEARMRGPGGNLERLTRALLTGDAEGLEEQLQAFVTNLLSFHDTGGLDPEQVYHGFLVGLLAVMEPEYQVRSNREAGQGRPDVTICPRLPGKPGAVLELKVARPGRKTPQAALAEGLLQLREMDYAAELCERGAAPVQAFVVALRGKQVWVKKYEAKKRPARRPMPPK